ncbi:hypothetical protein [Dictyobacter arantiisoli]|uniref:Uncharacterized protein n=1 Tax=Dictyobacter arantiisoli TaxID=2014874 RepID=A0A5A5TB01_9CHLR|nr:hypothetical protein [Dictyobacter arantiisoli]GCF08578.1 hypothetical protein KDI_21420 [Dictyobacter arantiisoli]
MNSGSHIRELASESIENRSMLEAPADMGNSEFYQVNSSDNPATSTQDESQTTRERGTLVKEKETLQALTTFTEIRQKISLKEHAQELRAKVNLSDYTNKKREKTTSLREKDAMLKEQALLQKAERKLHQRVEHLRDDARAYRAAEMIVRDYINGQATPDIDTLQQSINDSLADEKNKIKMSLETQNTLRQAGQDLSLMDNTKAMLQLRLMSQEVNPENARKVQEEASKQAQEHDGLYQNLKEAKEQSNVPRYLRTEYEKEMESHHKDSALAQEIKRTAQTIAEGDLLPTEEIQDLLMRIDGHRATKQDIFNQNYENQQSYNLYTTGNEHGQAKQKYDFLQRANDMITRIQEGQAEVDQVSALLPDLEQARSTIERETNQVNEEYNAVRARTGQPNTHYKITALDQKIADIDTSLANDDQERDRIIDSYKDMKNLFAQKIRAYQQKIDEIDTQLQTQDSQQLEEQ